MTEFRAVLGADELNAGEATIVTYGRLHVIVFNVDGTYYAIEDRCSHADVELSGGEVDLAACEITCPKHGARFDIKTGAALSAPAHAPVKTFDVRVQGGKVEIAPRPKAGHDA